MTGLVVMPAVCPDTVVEAAHARMRSVSHENIATLYAIFVRLASGEPLPMVLFCPVCGTQHVDKTEDGTSVDTDSDGRPTSAPWLNPPHRSHLCAGCGAVWRPADVATVGVAEIATRGGRDTFSNAKAFAAQLQEITGRCAACNGYGCNMRRHSGEVDPT